MGQFRLSAGRQKNTAFCRIYHGASSDPHDTHTMPHIASHCLTLTHPTNTVTQKCLNFTVLMVDILALCELTFQRPIVYNIGKSRTTVKLRKKRSKMSGVAAFFSWLLEAKLSPLPSSAHILVQYIPRGSVS